MDNHDLIKKGSMKKWINNKKVNLPCGNGSTIEVTIGVREFIEKCISKYNIKSISDAACGDYLWMKLVNKQGASYHGYDINEVMIEEIKQKYKEVDFSYFDVVHETLPKTDLIICRDCLFHLTTEDGVNTIKNFKESGSKYLMSTTFDYVDKNFDLQNAHERYGVRRINIKISPYNLGESIEKIYEPVFDRYFCLWKIN